MKVAAILFWGASLVLVLTSCSTPPARTARQPGEVTILIDRPSFGNAMGGDLMLWARFGEVKDMNRRPPFFIPPGKREVELSVGTVWIFRKYGSAFFELEFAPDHTYRLVPGRKDGDFTVEVIDITEASKPLSLQTVKIKGHFPDLVPIPLPVK